MRGLQAAIVPGTEAPLLRYNSRGSLYLRPHGNDHFGTPHELPILAFTDAVGPLGTLWGYLIPHRQSGDVVYICLSTLEL
jgi:hypothetical protein